MLKHADPRYLRNEHMAVPSRKPSGHIATGVHPEAVLKKHHEIHRHALGPLGISKEHLEQSLRRPRPAILGATYRRTQNTTKDDPYRQDWNDPLNPKERRERETKGEE
jgi:hypothetical protein